MTSLLSFRRSWVIYQAVNLTSADLEIPDRLEDSISMKAETVIE